MARMVRQVKGIFLPQTSQISNRFKTKFHGLENLLSKSAKSAAKKNAFPNPNPRPRSSHGFDPQSSRQGVPSGGRHVRWGHRSDLPGYEHAWRLACAIVVLGMPPGVDTRGRGVRFVRAFAPQPGRPYPL